MTDPELFLKARIDILILRGERAPKKRNLLDKIFWSKVTKNAFFGLFFSKFCLPGKNFAKQGLLVILKSSENQFSRLKKKVNKTFENF